MARPAPMVWLLLSAIGLLTAFQDGVIDRAIAGWFYDPILMDFPIRQSQFVDMFLYQGAKIFMTIVACVLTVIGIVLIRRRGVFTVRHLAVGVLGSLGIPVLMSILKSLTGIDCPWSIDQFGGTKPYETLWQALSTPGGTGRCFPAGHSAGGFVLFAWASAFGVFGRPWRDRLALIGVVLGGLMGLTRMAQGAHFLSHILWSAWFAVLFTMLLAAIFGLQSNRQEGAHS